MSWKRIRETWWLEILCILLVSGFIYLPWLKELTYNKDDWYFLFDGLVGGSEVFQKIALHTRPIRGPLYEFYFSLFGLNPFPYHLVMYFTRLLGGFGVLWLTTLLWPKQRFSNLVVSILFMIFPGFYWWVSGFEFQPYVLSVSLEIFSIVFTLKAISASSNLRRVLWTTAAIVFGWIYLALVEYAIGMELFRYLCLYLFISHQSEGLRVGNIVWRSIRAGAVFLLVPFGFLFWYQFLFDNWRKAQDAGTQLSELFSSASTALWSLLRLSESVLNVSILAWVVPFYSNFFNGRLGQLSIGIFFTLLTILVVWLTSFSIDEAGSRQDDATVKASANWQMEAILIGLIGTAGGVLPVVLANRIATFERYSHYTLPASLAGAFFLGGWLFLITSPRMRMVALSIVIGFAALTHHALATTALNEQKTIRDFWWQVAWRAPSIRPDALLVVVYPDVHYGDGDEVAWGPANFIYYPQRQEETLPNVTLAAIRMEAEAMRDVIVGEKVVADEDRVIKFNSITYNYRNILMLTQPSKDSCMHALDNQWQGTSLYDSTFILAGAKNSKIENIVTDGVAPVPPAYVFGSEPAHDWCYYFQKADLARQTGNWEEVLRIEKEATKLGLSPDDAIEWMPFLQAHALAGDTDKVRQIAKKVKKDDFYESQACANTQALIDNGYTLQPEMKMLTNELFCR